MRLLLLIVLVIHILGCGSVQTKQTKKRVHVNDKKYDSIIKASMRHAGMDISCVRLIEEIDAKLQKNEEFEVASHDRFAMTDGIRLALSMEYTLVPSQLHQGKRYKEAYMTTNTICRKDKSLSYLDALSKALSGTYANKPNHGTH